MTVLVFGRTGQVATELARLPGTTCLGRDLADFTDPAGCIARVQSTDATAVIIAAAYTAVDRAEEQEALATRINATTPGEIAQACAARGLPVVHISTDYVFDGAGERPFAPERPTGPLGAYGRSKLAGEEAVRAAGGVHAILRTSWVFSAQGTNFLKTMLRLAQTRDRLSVVADQIGGPTPAAAIARACLSLADTLSSRPETAGTYHLSGAPDTSWAAFARAIFAAAGQQVTVEDIATAAYPTPAQRPLNSRLDCTTLETVFGLTRPDWRAAVTQIVGEMS